MNTGIGDAVNLGWKLAEAVAGRAAPALLDSYEPERIAFARSLVATTDRVSQIVTDEGMRGRVFRTWILPHVVPTLAKFDMGQHAMFRLVSQIRIAYPDSPISEGKAGLRSGDRLPWVQLADGDNFAVLRSLGWQVHVYGEASAAVISECKGLELPLHRFPWTAKAGEAGLERDAVYLVRPDGYVALAARHDVAGKLTAYVDRHGPTFATKITATWPSHLIG